jgi:hypothetical protein
MTIDIDELQLLAAMAFGESSSVNNFEEMAGVASVLLRQRDARGYASMKAFTAAEPTYSYVVSDGNARYAAIMKISADDVAKQQTDAQKALADIQSKIKLTQDKVAAETNPKKKKSATVELDTLKKSEKNKQAHLKNTDGHAAAYAAARHALEGGEDYSSGGYFWDGADIKSNYKNHFKVRHGIKFTDPAHNIYVINDSTKLVIIKKITVKKVKGKSVKTEEEVGRYDHIYESTAAHGGTIFWKQYQGYLDLTGAKAYK